MVVAFNMNEERVVCSSSFGQVYIDSLTYVTVCTNVLKYCNDVGLSSVWYVGGLGHGYTLVMLVFSVHKATPNGSTL